MTNYVLSCSPRATRDRTPPFMSLLSILQSKYLDVPRRPGAAAKPKSTSTFRLTHYFSITRLVGVFIVLAILVFSYRYFAFHALQDHETRGNEAITRIFANTIWLNHASFVKSAAAIPKAELPQRSEVAEIRQDVLRQMKGRGS